MKKIILFLLTILIVSPAFSQEDEMMKHDPKAQEKIKAARIAFITERLGLTPDEAEIFWPVYREFSLKRVELKKQLDQSRIADPSKSNEQNEKESIDKGLQFKQKELDLEKEYSSKLLNVVTPQKVMALRAAENDFRKLVMKQIQQRQQMQQQRLQQRDRNEQRFKQRNN